MALVCSNCNRCGQRLDRSTGLVENHAVVRCARCRWYALEGDGKRFHEDELSQEEIIRELHHRAVVLERDRSVDWRIAAALDSDDDDVRWGWQ